MITITNIGQDRWQPDNHVYLIKIGKEPVATFTHKQSDGLAICLLKASREVGKVDMLKGKIAKEE